EDAGLPSFFRAEPSVEPAIGEWHMHCHVLEHMMMGMMGSLLVVTGGTFAGPLPAADLVCPDDVPSMPGMNGGGGGGPMAAEVDAIADGGNTTGFAFSPQNQTVAKGGTITFKNNSSQPHSIIWDTAGSPANSSVFNAGASVAIVMPNAGTFA